MSKSRVFGLRMTEADREAFERAAAEAAVAVGRPVTLSGWMLSVLRDAASGGDVGVVHGPSSDAVLVDRDAVAATSDANKAERLAKARVAQASVKARTPEEQAEFRRRMLSPSKGKRDE